MFIECIFSASHSISLLLRQQDPDLGVAEMAQLVKYFLCKHEEPSLIPSVHVKVIQGNMYFELQILGQENPRAREVETKPY